MLSGRTVVVGVSGGIAAYKACELVRWLTERGASVIVAMTPAAVQFVTPLTFQALSGNPVVRDLWGDQRPGFDLPPAAAGGRSKPGRWFPHRSFTTGLPESAWKVRGVTNSTAAGVIATITEAPRSVSQRTSSHAL